MGLLEILCNYRLHHQIHSHTNNTVVANDWCYEMQANQKNENRTRGDRSCSLIVSDGVPYDTKTIKGDLNVALTPQEHHANGKDLFCVCVGSYIAEPHGYQASKGKIERGTITGLEGKTTRIDQTFQEQSVSQSLCFSPGPGLVWLKLGFGLASCRTKKTPD